jgi:hypothetical protein
VSEWGGVDECGLNATFYVSQIIQIFVYLASLGRRQIVGPTSPSIVQKIAKNGAKDVKVFVVQLDSHSTEPIAAGAKQRKQPGFGAGNRLRVDRYALNW